MLDIISSIPSNYCAVFPAHKITSLTQKMHKYSDWEHVCELIGEGSGDLFK